MTIDDEYLEHHLGSLMTTAGTDLGEQTAVAPEIVTRARRRIDVDELFTGVRAGERTHISRAITLLESTAPAHRVLAQELLRCGHETTCHWQRCSGARSGCACH